MALNSWQFLVFVACAIACVRLSPTVLLRKLFMLGFSLIFLATYIASPRAAVVLAMLLAAIYALGLPSIRRCLNWTQRMLGVVIVVLWAFLFLVKDPSLLGKLNPFHTAPVAIVGISYFVFRGVSYLFESEAAPDATALDFLNYMLFFPAILAGPIERFIDFSRSYAIAISGPDQMLPALHRIANGYIKKFAIADNLAAFSVAGVGDPAGTVTSVLWIAAVMQLLLIYLDFSGYCDIAIGIASLAGVRLRENFDKPFASLNIKEFWERWHMSMSALMRDYVFTPMCKVIFAMPNTSLHWPMIAGAYCLTMVLVALWHGTTLGFLVFGLLHAAVLFAIQLRQRNRPRGPVAAISATQRYAWMTITYLFVSITLVLWMTIEGKWVAFYRGMLGM